MKISILTFLTSIAIAGVAAWYSILGLTTIFSAAVIPIIIMGIVLEIGKLVAASWVYTYWKETNILLKIYLVSAIVVLMIITSMGIYGFLSKSHIDAGINTTEILEMDTTLEKTEYGLFDDSRLEERKKQSIEREQLNDIITKAENNIDELLDKKSEYQLEVKNFEVEVGPIKYIAALIYGDEAKNYLDNTVRYVILLLIFVFDPLAVLLLISANHSYRLEIKENPPKQKPLPINVGKTVRTATVDRGVKKVTKERDGVKIHFYEADDGKG